MKKIMCIFALLAMVFVSCTKEKQVAGKDGNANVISSNIVTLNGWTSDINDGINFSYTINVSWPSVTQDIVSKGIVMVFVQTDENTWTPLPYTTSEQTESGGYYYSSSTLSFETTVGFVIINLAGYNEISGAPALTELNGSMVIRIVAISASTIATYPHTDWNNYTQIQSLIKQTK